MLMKQALGLMLLSKKILHLIGRVTARSIFPTCHQQCSQQLQC